MTTTFFISEYIKNFNYISSYYEYFSKLNKHSNYNASYNTSKVLYNSIDDFITNYQPPIPEFSTFIYEKLKNSNFKTEAELYKDADITRQRWSDLINNKLERPNKDSLFKLAISLRLSINDLDTLLATKGYCINHHRYRDKILTYFFLDPDGKEILKLKSYDRNYKINSLLDELHQAPLY